MESVWRLHFLRETWAEQLSTGGQKFRILCQVLLTTSCTFLYLNYNHFCILGLLQQSTARFWQSFYTGCSSGTTQTSPRPRRVRCLLIAQIPKTLYAIMYFSLLPQGNWVKQCLGVLSCSQQKVKKKKQSEKSLKCQGHSWLHPVLLYSSITSSSSPHTVVMWQAFFTPQNNCLVLQSQIKRTSKVMVIWGNNKDVLSSAMQTWRTFHVLFCSVHMPKILAFKLWPKLGQWHHFSLSCEWSLSHSFAQSWVAGSSCHTPKEFLQHDQHCYTFSQFLFYPLILLWVSKELQPIPAEDDLGRVSSPLQDKPLTDNSMSKCPINFLLNVHVSDGHGSIKQPVYLGLAQYEQSKK